jgi:hypothetical protein
MKLLPTPTQQDSRIKVNNVGDSQHREERVADVVHKLTLSPVASPASHFLPPESEKGRMMTATCGRRCLESYLSLSRGGSSLKMFVEYLLLKTEWYSSKCLLTWKVSATKFNRLLFQLQPSTPRTDEIGFGLLPTPRQCEAEGGAVQNVERNAARGFSRKNLDGVAYGVKVKDIIAMLPTPRAGNPGSRPNGKGGKILAEEVAKMLPTPATRDYRGANGPEHLEKERGHHDQLPNALGMKTGLKLQPAFVEWMMGYPQGWTDLNCQNQDIEWNG